MNFNKFTDFKVIAESWELSTNKNGKWIIANGSYKDMYLSDIIYKCPQKFFRDIGFPDLPILVKLKVVKIHLSSFCILQMRNNHDTLRY